MNMYEWADEMNCAVTVCDTQGIILYMNAKVYLIFMLYKFLVSFL